MKRFDLFNYVLLLYLMAANILPFDGEIFYFPDVLDADSERLYCQVIKDETPWQQQSVKIFGKWIPEPRLTCFYGDAGKCYSYSGLRLEPLAWTPALLQLKNLSESYSGTLFNVALLNYYRDGKDSMGWHRDNEPELGTEPIIASFSLGAARKFSLRNFADKSVKQSIILEPGSLLVMRGKSQSCWEHCVPKTSKAEERINITFRRII